MKVEFVGTPEECAELMSRLAKGQGPTVVDEKKLQQEESGSWMWTLVKVAAVAGAIYLVIQLASDPESEGFPDLLSGGEARASQLAVYAPYAPTLFSMTGLSERAGKVAQNVKTNLGNMYESTVGTASSWADSASWYATTGVVLAGTAVLSSFMGNAARLMGR